MRRPLSLAFDATAARPLDADQLAISIAEQLRNPSCGGAHLPSPRALGHRLGLAEASVRRAYATLRARGLIRAGGAKGTFVVSGRAPRAVAKVPFAPFKPALDLPSVAPKSGAPVQLGSVFIDPRLLPREALQDCARRVLERRALSVLGDPQGFAPLREAIAERLRSRGFDARAEHVITTVGSQHALDLVGRTLIRGPIATEDPSYHYGKALLERIGLRPLGLRVDPFAGADLAQWERALFRKRPRLLYLTSRFQNPTGYSYTEPELRRIVGWAAELDFAILEDDWAAEMLSHSAEPTPLRSLGGRAVLYMNSFTKKLWPSLRIGYVLANETSAPALLASKRVAVGSSPALGEAVLHEFLASGEYDAHLARMQAELDRRYHNCLQLLRHHMPDGVRWTTPGGGPALWVECPPNVDLPSLAARLRARQFLLPLSEGAFFGRAHLHGFKLGYACLTQAEMQRGVETLASNLKRTPRRTPRR